MKPLVTKKNNFYPYLLLFIQPIFMASNIIVARGGVEYVPPVSLAFWRWLTVFFILMPFFFNEIIEKKRQFKSEFFKLFILGLTGCGICGAFPFIAGMSTTMANMGIIYTSSPIFIIAISVLFFNDRINLSRVIGLILCLSGVLVIICKGDLTYLINFFNNNFLFWVLFAAISPGIIAFTLYTKVQKYVGASLAGFTLYIFSIYSAIYGIILFEESLLNFHYFGAILVFSGVYLARKIVK